MIYLGTGGSLVAARLSKGEFRLCALQPAGDWRQIYELALISQLFPWNRLT